MAGDDLQAAGDYITCTECERKDPACHACGGVGHFKIRCPVHYVGSLVWELIEAADLIEKTGWPLGRGWAEEPAALVDGVARVWAEFQRIKNEQIKRLNNG